MDFLEILLDVVSFLSDGTGSELDAYFDEEIEEISQEELDKKMEARKMVPWRCKACYRENPAEEEICLGCKKER